MDLIADRGRRVAIEELNTGRLLAHARKQARERNLDDVLVADVDSHHYENECYNEFLPFIENEGAPSARAREPSQGPPDADADASGLPGHGGRITRYPMRSSEKTDGGKPRDVQLGHRWMDAMSVDYACLFPTMLLAVGLHPSTEMEIELSLRHYNRWLTEKALPEADGRFYSMLAMPFSRIPTRRCARRSRCSAIGNTSPDL